MAALKNGVSSYLHRLGSNILRSAVSQRNPHLQFVRCNTLFKHIHRTHIHGNEDYEYEVFKNPEEWKYVERLLRPAVVPAVTQKAEYPSGWRPQTAKSNDFPYFVQRTKNHMLPVYLLIKNDGLVKVTIIKKVYGDIQQLQADIEKYLLEKEGRKFSTLINEANLQLKFKGDHVYYIEQFLLSKGM